MKHTRYFAGIFTGALILISSGFAHGACQVTKSQDQANDTIQEYRSEKNPTNKSVLIMPPTGGENILDRKLAGVICDSGLNSVIFNYAQLPGDVANLGTHDEATLRTLQSLNNFLSTRSEQFVLVGSSLGSLYTSMALGLSRLPHGNQFPAFQKIRGAVLVVCGGPLSEILATSQLKEVVAQRNARLQMFGYKNASEYQKALDGAIALDPLKLTVPELKSKVLMFSSSVDVAVPAHTQDELWQAWGQPERHMYSVSHAETIVKVYLFQGAKIREFAQSVF